MDCIFCKIAAGELPSKKVFENDNVLAFHDITPKAPVHVMMIPKKHISSAVEITGENSEVVAEIFEAIARIAVELGLTGGFRVGTNVGVHGAQTIPHLHFHLLGGRQLAADMG